MPEDAALPELARSAARLDLGEVPAPVRAHAMRVIADTLGVIYGGACRPEIQALVGGEGPLALPLGTPPARVVAPGWPEADPGTAALVNATAGTFLELDEGGRPTGHPCIHVVPPALAAAQALRASGHDLLGAILSGYEVSSRLFSAYRLTYPMHPHGHFGAVGGAVAVARLAGDDAGEPAAIASTLPLLAVWQPCFEGATVRNAYAGVAAWNAVLAHRLARAGFTGSRQAQEVAFGELAGKTVDPGALAAPVSATNLAITRNYLKLHSSCALTHGALDAVFALPVIAPDNVIRVEVETVENNMKVARQALPNDLSTRFSLPYAVAAAIVHRETGPPAFIPDERVAQVAERVEIRHDPELDREWPQAAPTRVTVHTREGTQTARVDNPRGHHANPADPAELRDKFRRLVDEPWTDELYLRLLALHEAEDVSTLFDALV